MSENESLYTQERCAPVGKQWTKLLEVMRKNRPSYDRYTLSNWLIRSISLIHVETLVCRQKVELTRREHGKRKQMPVFWRHSQAHGRSHGSRLPAPSLRGSLRVHRLRDRYEWARARMGKRLRNLIFKRCERVPQVIDYAGLNPIATAKSAKELATPSRRSHGHGQVVSV